jgi:hypothetical protein
MGVASYPCEAATEWGVMLAGEVDPETIMKNGGTEILNGIHTWMTIGKSGDPKFEQRPDGPISDVKRKEIVDTLVRKQKKTLARFCAQCHAISVHRYDSLSGPELPARRER